MKPAATWQQNYANSAATAQAAWVAGIKAPGVDWSTPTVNAIPRMVSGFNAAAASGAISSGILNAGNQRWQSQSEAKASAYGLGITNGAAALGRSANLLYQFYQSAIPALPARGDINQNILRGNTLSLALHAQKGNFKGR